MGLETFNFFTANRALFSVIFTQVWQWTGWAMVIYLANLQSISKDLYEAADIDGTSGLQRFFYITLPSLKSVIKMVIALEIVSAINAFDLLYVLTGGGPGRATNVLVNHIYNAAFVDFKFGYASASALVLFAIVLVITLIQLWGEKKFTDFV